MVDGLTTDGRTTDGRRLDGYTIGSPCEPNDSGELTSPCDLDPLTIQFDVQCSKRFLTFALKHILWVPVRTNSMRWLQSVPTI